MNNRQKAKRFKKLYETIKGTKVDASKFFPISTTKNNLVVDPIDRVELLRAMNTWDKFEYSSRYGLERLDKDDKGFVPYVKYDDMLKCVTGMPSVTPIRPKGHWIYDYTSADGHKIYHCSECGCYLKPKHSEPLNSFKWCSLCGADMGEE